MGLICVGCLLPLLDDGLSLNVLKELPSYRPLRTQTTYGGNESGYWLAYPWTSSNAYSVKDCNELFRFGKSADQGIRWWTVFQNGNMNEVLKGRLEDIFRVVDSHRHPWYTLKFGAVYPQSCAVLDFPTLKEWAVFCDLRWKFLLKTCPFGLYVYLW